MIFNVLYAWRGGVHTLSAAEPFACDFDENLKALNTTTTFPRPARPIRTTIVAGVEAWWVAAVQPRASPGCRDTDRRRANHRSEILRDGLTRGLSNGGWGVDA